MYVFVFPPLPPSPFPPSPPQKKLSQDVTLVWSHSQCLQQTYDREISWASLSLQYVLQVLKVLRIFFIWKVCFLLPCLQQKWYIWFKVLVMSDYSAVWEGNHHYSVFCYLFCMQPWHCSTGLTVCDLMVFPVWPCHATTITMVAWLQNKKDENQNWYADVSSTILDTQPLAEGYGVGIGLQAYWSQVLLLPLATPWLAKNLAVLQTVRFLLQQIKSLGWIDKFCFLPYLYSQNKSYFHSAIKDKCYALGTELILPRLVQKIDLQG